VILAILMSAGCSSTREPSAVNLLQAKVVQLERKLAVKDNEIEQLHYKLGLLADKISSPKRHHEKEEVGESEFISSESYGNTLKSKGKG